jgi:hypothetical protein
MEEMASEIHVTPATFEIGKKKGALQTSSTNVT